MAFRSLFDWISRFRHRYSPVDAFDEQPVESQELMQLVIEQERGKFRLPTDVDTWLIQLYLYYEKRGFKSLVASKILNIASVIYTLGFSGFLLLFVDWFRLWDCAPKCASRDVIGLHVTNGWYLAGVCTYLGVLSVYCVYIIVMLCYELPLAKKMKQFVNQHLEISERELLCIQWSTIMNKLVNLQDSHEANFLQGQHNIHDIVQRIMRKDNYLIALMDHPYQIICPTVNFPLLGKCQVWTKTQHWIIMHVIIDSLFAPDHEINSSFLVEGAGAALQRRLWIFGVLNMILAPFIVLFVVINTIFSTASELHHNPTMIGNRCWSTFAEWKFREFNELPYLLRSRMDRGIPLADKYVDQFRSPVHSAIARFVTFVLQCLFAIMVILGLLNESFMDVKLFLDRNLWWYLGVLCASLAVTHSFIIHSNEVLDPEEAMRAVVTETHYFPKRWHGRVHQPRVFQEFGHLFPLKIVSFLLEIVGVFLTPFLLWFYISPNASKIISFLRMCTESKTSIGAVCTFADFQLSVHGNRHFGAERHHDDRSMRSRGGKLERSVLGFMTQHPEWQPGKDVEAFHQNVMGVENRLRSSSMLEQQNMEQRHPMQNSFFGALRQSQIRPHRLASLSASQSSLLMDASQHYPDHHRQQLQNNNKHYFDLFARVHELNSTAGKPDQL